MGTITSRAELRAFLSAHRCFTDCCVKSISPLALPSGLPSRLELRIAYQIDGNWEAGTMRRLREMEIVATDVREWTLDESAYYVPGHCSEGVTEIDAGDLLGLEFDLPAIVRLVCGRLDVSDPIEFDEWIEPRLSYRCFLEIRGARLPTPLEWRSVLREVDGNVQWHMYGGGAIDPERVPADSSGWYLGYALPDAERPEPGPAVIIEGRIDERDVLRLSITRVGDAYALWTAANAFAARLGEGAVRCGVCRFTTAEWLAYLETGALPVRMKEPETGR